MTDDELRELIALAAVDALDPDDERVMRDALADRPDLAAELDDLRDAAATMATAVAETPPPALRASVLEAIAAEARSSGAPPPPVAPVTVLASRRRRRILLAAAAAVVGLASAAVATRVLDDSTADEIAAVLDDDGAVTVTLTGEIGDLRVVYSDDEGRAVMVGDGVATLSDDQVYELWMLPAGRDDMVSLGTFRPDGDGVVEEVMEVELEAFTALAVTIEPPGGSQVPSGPPVAQSE